VNPHLISILAIAFLAALVFAAVRMARADSLHRQMRRFRRDRIGVIALGVVTVYLLIGLAGLITLPDGNNAISKAFAHVPQERSYSAPWASAGLDGKPLKGWHFFGTDALGKDVLKETLLGCSTALLIGGLTSLVYIPIGVLFGIAAGYFKGRADSIIQFVYSTVACIPQILLLVSMLLVLGKGVPQMTLALGLTGWVGLCRLLRGETMRQSERPYIEAARALGQNHWKIIVRHLLPNVMHLVIINFILGFSGIVLAESLLSYIGVGLPIGTASWGAMIDGARMELSREPSVWWNITAATTALFGLVLSLNLLGDALRRAFDPKAA